MRKRQNTTGYSIQHVRFPMIYSLAMAIDFTLHNALKVSAILTYLYMSSMKSLSGTHIRRLCNINFTVTIFALDTNTISGKYPYENKSSGEGIASYSSPFSVLLRALHHVMLLVPGEQLAKLCGRFCMYQLAQLSVG